MRYGMQWLIADDVTDAELEQATAAMPHEWRRAVTRDGHIAIGEPTVQLFARDPRADDLFPQCPRMLRAIGEVQ